MHRVVVDEPYKFVPPYRRRWFSKLFRLWLNTHSPASNTSATASLPGKAFCSAQITAAMLTRC